MGQTSESTYLYAEKNRDLYQSVLDQFNDKNCVFSRNLLAFLESPQREPGPFYSRHVNECPACQAKVHEFSKTLQNIQRHIPDHSAPDDLSLQVRPEIKEAINFWKKKQKALEKSDKILAADFVKEATKDFFTKGLLSRSFAKGLLWAGFSAILLIIIF